jgi:hypothetical protein
MKGKRQTFTYEFNHLRFFHSINMECFEALRRADIYAIGLLYWEVCRRTMSCGIAEEYKGEKRSELTQKLF